MEILMKTDTIVQVTTREVNTPPEVDFDVCESSNDVFATSAKKKYEFARVSIKAKAVRVGELEPSVPENRNKTLKSLTRQTRFQLLYGRRMLAASSWERHTTLEIL